MVKIGIIGGGFGGLSALKTLRAISHLADVTLIDKKGTFDFLPLLPDIIGREIPPEFLKYDLASLKKAYSCQFIQSEVTDIDIEKRRVQTASGAWDFDYIIMAAGTETNFYGNALLKEKCFRLDEVIDAQKIKEAAASGRYRRFVIAGGGYTGVEIATNIRKYFSDRGESRDIIIVEKAASILGPLPSWMKTYVSSNLKATAIEVMLQGGISGYDGFAVTLESGQRIEEAMLIWAAGVKAVDFISRLKAERKAQNRLATNSFLQISDSCFAAGDCAFNLYRGAPLRLGVQFAIAQGQLAALNVIRLMGRKKPRAYFPLDLGYVVPMANNVSCGTVVGVNVKGQWATFLHYGMCFYRSLGLRNKWGLLRALLIRLRRNNGNRPEKN